MLHIAKSFLENFCTWKLPLMSPAFNYLIMSKRIYAKASTTFYIVIQLCSCYIKREIEMILLLRDSRAFERKKNNESLSEELEKLAIRNSLNLWAFLDINSDYCRLIARCGSGNFFAIKVSLLTERWSDFNFISIGSAHLIILIKSFSIALWERFLSREWKVSVPSRARNVRTENYRFMSLGISQFLMGKTEWDGSHKCWSDVVHDKFSR